ncbi:MAG: dCTP deaminase [Candidatus Pacebacteria bacterium]|nr:dCTP deaminase [Candidatus Paceibacterota bacterium]
MILSDRDILKRIEKGDLKIEPFKHSCVQPSTVDLHLSSELRVFNNWDLGVIDLIEKVDPSKILEINEKGFIIHPGEFLLGATMERITMPNDLAGKLEGRSSFGRLGLIIHATAGYVDPGFSGWLTFEISNISRIPIRIYPKMSVAQICIFQMTSEVIRPYGSKGLGSKYQGQKGPTASRIWMQF